MQARHSERKSPEDLMAVYAMLAAGSVFSSGLDRLVENSLFAKVGEYATVKSHGKYSLQLAHSWLLLASYHFSTGEAQKSRDYGSMAIRTASDLIFSLESEYQDIRESDELEYNNMNSISTSWQNAIAGPSGQRT